MPILVKEYWAWCTALVFAILVGVTNSSILALIAISSYVLIVHKRAPNNPWKKAFIWSCYGALYILVFRILATSFLGLPTSGRTLVTLPTIHLPHFMTGVIVGGPITFEKLSATFHASLLIAFIVVSFGFANTFSSPSLFIKLIPKRFIYVRTALSIAMSTYPHFVGSLTRIRIGQSIRRGRDSKSFFILLPILQEAISRALALSRSLSSRLPSSHTAFGGNLDLVNFSVTHPGSSSPCITDISLHLHQGQCAIISGDTGVGKSTLLRAIHSSLPQSAYLPQVAEDSFIEDTVRKEVLFAQHVDVDVEEIARLCGIEHLLDRPLTHLSGGEKQLVALAAAIASNPSLLLLDEPTSELDDFHANQIVEALVKIQHKGTIILIADHHPHTYAKLHPLLMQLVDGRLSDVPHAESKVPTHTLANVRCITGPIGSGKTSHLKSLFLDGDSAYLPQNPADILMYRTIREECEVNDKDWNLLPQTTWDLVSTFIKVNPDSHPLDLSVGQKLILAFSIIAARSPKRLLLDEPTRGLDTKMIDKLIDYFVKHPSMEVIIATHRTDLARALSNHVEEFRYEKAAL